MKRIEYLVAGAVGGALGSIGMALLVGQGSLVEVLSAAVLSYVSNIPMLLAAILLGWVAGSVAKSGLGATLGGLAVPLVFVAFDIVF